MTKLTKKEMFTLIATTNADNAEIVEFCNHEIKLLNRKVTGTRKPTKNQIENEKIKADIMNILAENDRPMAINELMNDERLHGLANQKISALMTQLKKADLVVRTEDKRKAFFSIKG